MKKYIFASIAFVSMLVSAQETPFKFKELVNNSALPIISQGKTGTCWSFSTTSFLESEVKRLTGKDVDLSEMYNVRFTYPVKAYNYIYRQGKAQFSEGGLSHDVLNSVRKNGLVPNEVYAGFANGTDVKHNHEMLVKDLKVGLDSIVKNPKKYLTADWKSKFDQKLNDKLGVPPTKFKFEGKEYTPQEFAKFLKINPDDYVTLTSFQQAPYYSQFILQVPDNFSNGSYYNLPLDEYMKVLDEALYKGYTAAFDTDVSEKTFSKKYGMAIWPSEGLESDYFVQILPEKWVSADERQAAFEDYSTEDDHLMHITGILKDQLGNQYYDVKNSWGTTDLGNNGHIYMSKPFFRMKSIAYTVHKDALSKEVKKQLGIK
ncbi:C1 family peptidase [Empedobacter sp.]|uniref:C1 family peptidase n=1 Tax=Empedobacter sp. TaxID=1927715 RepID=UPI0028A6A06A|nr:C1 family peptidase [Empedobacter sp.]